MGEKHHLMRHEDKAQTRLRGHTVDHSTALTRTSGKMGEGRWMGKLQPRGLGERGTSGKLGSGLTTTKQTTG